MELEGSGREDDDIVDVVQGGLVVSEEGSMGRVDDDGNGGVMVLLDPSGSTGEVIVMEESISGIVEEIELDPDGSTGVADVVDWLVVIDELEGSTGVTVEGSVGWLEVVVEGSVGMLLEEELEESTEVDDDEGPVEGVDPDDGSTGVPTVVVGVSVDWVLEGMKVGGSTGITADVVDGSVVWLVIRSTGVTDVVVEGSVV